MPIERIHCGPRMSQVVIYNDTVYLAGQVASGAGGASVAEQAKDILARIDELLADAGSDKTRLLTATIWLVDMASFAEMNRVWEAWVATGAAPARATVASPQLASPDHRIEIAVTAARS
jgi:enamine deaminase RidA (YjgF/YER057c/UK114 family)